MRHIKTIAMGAALVAALLPSSGRAGTTVITHGFSPLASQPPDWAFTMARAILAADGDTSDCGDGAGTPIGTVFRYDPGTGAWQHECGSPTPNGEFVLIFDWTEESDGLNVGGTQGYAAAAADALYAALRDPQLPAAFAGQSLLAPSVHFIGFSRGTVVNSDCVERLAGAGIAVDHVTTLDPHPVDGTLDYPLDFADWGDRTPVSWTNVGFADNYWRADGSGIPESSDFDGMPLGADVDLDLGDSIEGPFDLDPIFEHFEVHAWYHGSIDLSAADDGAGTDIDDELFTDWYGSNGVPDRDTTGFHYSDIVQGTRPAQAARTAPSWSPLEIYNGDFEIVDEAGANVGIGYAGWLYHGGDKAGVLVPWSSLDPPPGSLRYLTLFGNGSERALTHNRLHVDDSVGGIEFDRRVAIPSTNDRLRIVFSDAGGDSTIVDAALDGATAWESVTFPIFAADTDRTVTLRIEIDGAGDGVESIVDIDDLHFVPEPGSSMLLGAGLAALLWIGRRRNTKQARRPQLPLTAK
jgi:hypothetical protein